MQRRDQLSNLANTPRQFWLQPHQAALSAHYQFATGSILHPQRMAVVTSRTAATDNPSRRQLWAVKQQSIKSNLRVSWLDLNVM